MLNEEEKHAQLFCEKFPIGFLSSHFLYFTIEYFVEVRKLNLIVHA